jgi:hypothetical protein
MRWVRRIPEGLLILFALPAYQLWHIAKYANTRKGRAAKIGVFINFLPMIAISTVIWGFLWAVMLWLLWRDISLGHLLLSLAAIREPLLSTLPTGLPT